MAKVSPNSPLAGASGRLGTAVTYMLNGKQVIRALPSRPRKFKATTMQQEHFNSFAAQHAFARAIKQSVIDRIWSLESMPVGLNPYNYFLKCNRNAFGKSNHVEFPELMILSVGNLLPVEGLQCSYVDNALHISWNNTVFNKYAREDDGLQIALLLERQSILCIEGDVTRSAGGVDLIIPKPAGDVVEGFLYWSASNEDAFSPSVYFKIIINS